MPAISAASWLNNLRARSYATRVPLFTRGVLAGIVVFWVVGVQSVWDVRAWGALVPDRVGTATC